MSIISYQNALLVAILCYDLTTMAHMLHWHWHWRGGFQSKWFSVMWGLEDFKLKMSDPAWTIAHVAIGIVPLLLSLFQLCTDLRNKYLDQHRKVGYVLIACSLLQIPTTVYLGLTWVSEEIVPVMKYLFGAFGFLWGIVGFLVYWTIKQGNLLQHRRWAVRFTVIAHYIPIWGRAFLVMLWTARGRPLDYQGSIDAFQLGIWVLLVMFVPFTEFFVWMETGYDYRAFSIAPGVSNRVTPIVHGGTTDSAAHTGAVAAPGCLGAPAPK